jgi:signal transduction histidine kinase
MIPVILLDENASRRTELARVLGTSGNVRTIVSPSPEDALAQCRAGQVEAIIVQDDGAGDGGIAVLRTLREGNADIPLVLISGACVPHFIAGARAYNAWYVPLLGPDHSWCPVLEQVIGTVVRLHAAERERAVLTKKLELVGSVTRHDVQNQLTAVSGYNELLLMMVEDPTFKSYLTKMQEALVRINRQFQFSKEYQNLGNVPPGFQLVRAAVNRAADLVDIKTVMVSATCGNAAVCADPLFDRAITNMVVFAARPGAGTTEITVSVEPNAFGAAVVCAGNGAGVPAADKEKIFEYGYQKDTAAGLFFAREILAMTGITLTENGEPGTGTRFVMQVPGWRFRSEGV